eukprot:8333832-Alexandrium_andersonii.AAC.1
MVPAILAAQAPLAPPTLRARLPKWHLHQGGVRFGVFGVLHSLWCLWRGQQLGGIRVVGGICGAGVFEGSSADTSRRAGMSGLQGTFSKGSNNGACVQGSSGKAHAEEPQLSSHSGRPCAPSALETGPGKAEPTRWEGTFGLAKLAPPWLCCKRPALGWPAQES